MFSRGIYVYDKETNTVKKTAKTEGLISDYVTVGENYTRALYVHRYGTYSYLIVYK